MNYTGFLYVLQYCTYTSWKTFVDEELLEDLKTEKEAVEGAGKGGRRREILLSSWTVSSISSMVNRMRSFGTTELLRCVIVQSPPKSCAPN